MIDLKAVQIKAIPIIMTLSYNDLSHESGDFPTKRCKPLSSLGFIRSTFDKTEVMILPEHDSLKDVADE